MVLANGANFTISMNSTAANNSNLALLSNATLNVNTSGKGVGVGVGGEVLWLSGGQYMWRGGWRSCSSMVPLL